ncbi:putative endonuclease IV [Buchnera aphidicola str. Bp (Baizongia pistaciae)]|uniref:Probable endonuclease 4 n=1 Tax=Buchnera aphidicola subsp. Baizongia pistaciae (strain Bp) TaxID=224915 RepID=END4_BUCBP|nr:deoxyribonuclease IV [Buchnera aphidicola]P59496.1 RecName: Full=Probable endonuclease 4; AltName: Full=Endodeoxyribonuclease IV; AltName: Full=Endonuclease IV [Buchnera aphidicola str. Bp (Baizongia pistaciae)]AAO26862.1 putative endonuclease IV [Buchnera aphidicola str. Bp (Baizongia pistaciae)]
MKYIGAHVSAAGGLDQVIFRSKELGATAFSFFLSNPLRWNLIQFRDETIKKFIFLCKKFNYVSDQILPHSSYLINLGHPSDEHLKKSRLLFVNEIINCKKLNLSLLNFHPGSHLRKISEQHCLIRVADSINFALQNTVGVKLVIENTAGQGSNIGYCFEHLAQIIHKVKEKDRIGICLDTCHLHASGYDLKTELGCRQTFKAFNDIVGLHYLSGMHINDSKTKRNSRIDRHHNLGQGYIGKSSIRWIIRNINFKLFPMILETTNNKLWKDEINWINSL